ncbi:MAG: hypothetical protein IJC48_03650 [Clostridia bacterium]|nr:hypothetical protein [Clostridia bacterium]
MADTDEERDMFLKMIRSECSRMQEVIENILLLSKAEARSPEDIQHVNVRSLAQEIAQSLSIQAAKKGIRMYIEGETLLSANEKDIWEVLYNLMSNAVFYGKEGGFVRVLLSEGKITVEDDGIGISSEHIHQLFEPFYRVDEARVLSAALLQLSEVTADDIRHFSRDFKISESVVTRLYYIALGNCLWADTLLNKNAQDATEVLRVFLDPDSVLNGREQADIIRRIITDEEIALLASMLGFHEDFVRYLIMDEDWKNPMPDDFSGVYAGSPDKGAPAPGRTPAASSALVTSAPAATPSPHPTLSPSAALLPSPSPSPSSTVHAQETEGFDDYEDSDEPEEYPSYDDSPDDDFESMDWTQDYDSSDD